LPRDKETIRQEIFGLIREYHQSAFSAAPFVPGSSPVPVSGRVFDATDMQSLADSALDFWLTTGRFARQFEARFAKEVFGLRHAFLVNSGSSANLVAVSALTSHLLERPLAPGDEVITAAAGFPTTVNPILQNQLVPVFIDAVIPTYNADTSLLEQALSPRTRAIVMAHTLGNPFNLEAVSQFAKKHGLYLVEDCCDAVGSFYQGRSVGTFGDLATTSFYPAHHITMGEGGCVLTDTPVLKRIIESLRDWGRDCWCDPGKDNTCGKRFEWKLGDLPEGYDHKYTYSHLGYNLKLTDMQAAVGVAQLDHLPSFSAARRENFRYFRSALKDLEEFLILPEATEGSDPSWFGFPITVREGAPFKRDPLLIHLNSKKIGTRLLFAGNITRQPYMKGRNFRVAGALDRTDAIMRGTFWTGTYPGLSREMLDYTAACIRDFIRGAK
jgi:CDP-6-deoxy-D-xylo-4-hexulose-3-dehydrase